MHDSRRYFNEKLLTRTQFLFRVLLTVILVFLIALLAPVLRPPRRHLGTGTAWGVASVIAVMCVLYSFFEKMFISIHFDYVNKVVNVTFRTMLDGDKIQVIPFSELAYHEEKAGGMSIAPTKALELFKGKRRVIKLEAKAIGEYTFGEICKELIAIEAVDEN